MLGVHEVVTLFFKHLLNLLGGVSESSDDSLDVIA